GGGQLADGDTLQPQPAGQLTGAAQQHAAGAGALGGGRLGEAHASENSTTVRRRKHLRGAGGEVGLECASRRTPPHPRPVAFLFPEPAPAPRTSPSAHARDPTWSPPMLFETLSTSGHEQVVFCNNPDTDLKAIIALHNTELGPARDGHPIRHDADHPAAG